MILQLHKQATISLCACITVMFLTSAGMAAWSSTEMPIMPHVSKGIHITYSKTTHALALPKAEVNRMVSAAQAMKGPEVIKQFVNGAKSRVKKVSVPVIPANLVNEFAAKGAHCVLGFHGITYPASSYYGEVVGCILESMINKGLSLTAAVGKAKKTFKDYFEPDWQGENPITPEIIDDSTRLK